MISSPIKSMVVSFVLSFTGHGFSKLITSKNSIVKAIWAFFILIGMAATMYYITMTVEEYFEYNVITNIKTIYPQSITFPAITLCPALTERLDIIHCQFELIHAHPCNFTNFTIYNQEFERYDCFTVNGPEQHRRDVSHQNI